MASSIVQSAAQQMGKLLVEEAKFLYKVSDKIESLQMELKWMECFLRDADTQQHREEVVCLWVSQARDLTYDAEDTIESYLHRVSRHRENGIRNTVKWFSCILFSCDAWTLHKLGSDIDDLTVRMSELTSRLRMYGIQIIRPTKGLEYNALIREEFRTHSHTEEDVVGLIKDIQLVVDQLVHDDSNVKVVGISGTGGLGKTTLARKVFKHKDVKDHFNDNCVWVYISKEFENGSIFREILFGLTKDERTRRVIKDLPVEELLKKIHELLQKQNCLVVLDDIWTDRSWERLKPAFESILTGNSPSKILLTTRNQKLLPLTHPSGYLYFLQPLSPDDSWELLRRKAFIGQANGTADGDQVKRQCEMEKLGKEILKHCGGLPIAIVAVGGILSTKKTLSEWEDVRTNISSYLMSGMEQEGTTSRIMEILELSYNELPFYLKPCFLYLGIFPEDYIISTQKLYHLWQAEGFLAIEGEAREKGGTTYDIGERYLNELIQRSMVQPKECWISGRIKTCQVHDVMRDMCIRKCKEVSFLSHIECTTSGMVSVLPHFSTETKKLRRCALQGGDDAGEELQLGEKAIGLRSLLVFNQRFEPASKIWKSIPLLRVLDIEGASLDHLYGLNCLIHLRYLSMRGIGMYYLPSGLFDLQYLETLDLRMRKWVGIRLTNKLHKMKRLRHLYLPQMFRVNGGERLSFPIGGQMETIKNFDPERCEVEQLMGMTNLMVFSITNVYIFDKAKVLKGVLEAPVMKNAGQLINSFSIRIHEDLIINEDPAVLREAAHHLNFKKLEIRGPRSSNGGKKGNSSITFPNSLKRVELINCEIDGEEGNVLSGLEKLPCLQVLRLDEPVIGGGGNKMSFSPRSFPQLTQLCIKHPWTGSLFDWELGEEAVPNLQLLELTGCGTFNQLPNSLTRVELWKCGITEGQVSTLEKLSHLKFLQVYGVGCNKLSFSPGSFLQLGELHLAWLDESGEWEVGEGALPSLKILQLERVKKVVYKLPDSLTQVKLEDWEFSGEGDFSLFACLEKLPHLQLLHVHLAETADLTRMGLSPGSFPQLTELNFFNSHHQMELELGEDSLPRLQSLYVYGLNKVNKLPDSLTWVRFNRGELVLEDGDSLIACLEKLPLLQQLFLSHPRVLNGNKMSFSTGSFPQLTQLHLTGLDKLEEWEVGEGALSNLRQLYLGVCRSLKKLPQGLPDSIHIECEDPCIKGIEKYNTCPYTRKNGRAYLKHL